MQSYIYICSRADRERIWFFDDDFVWDYDLVYADAHTIYSSISIAYPIAFIREPIIMDM